MKALAEAGVIPDCTAVFDRSRVGLSQCVIAELKLTPQSVSCWATTGAADHGIKVLVPDIAGCEQFPHSVAFKLPGVTHVRCGVVLKEVKVQTRLPISVPAVSCGAQPAGTRARPRA